MGNNGNGFLGFLAGGAIGVMLGVLFAPDKGSSTRKKVLDEALLVKNELSEKASDIIENLESSLNNKEFLEEQLDSMLTNVSYKADDLIEYLENKLTLLKEKNKSYQRKSNIDPNTSID
ncbi:YtxH domain-containing protein [Cognatitamlana onchidii]|uniref:YtxH domain-containing protein n=1 Tax=Cognatitamlana onchidii TaxID=2562860 RepID=UPI0010A5C3FF|nr:YtxH domain-containing protein [Algibacter onchidii]